MNGETLKKLREELGYSKKTLAGMIYVTEYIIQSWEEDWALTDPSSSEIEGLAEAFNMPTDSIREMLDHNIDDD